MGDEVNADLERQLAAVRELVGEYDHLSGNEPFFDAIAAAIAPPPSGEGSK